MSRLVRASCADTARGMALMESLVALTLVSVTLMGLLWVQWKTLADSAASVRRSQAIQLIEDLSERVRSNPQAPTRLDDYRIEWAQAAEASANCQIEACGAASLARWDLARWKRGIAQQLPKGDAAVYAEPDLTGAAASMLTVMVGWRSSEESPSQAEGDVRSPCPTGWVCHFGHVQP